MPSLATPPIRRPPLPRLQLEFASAYNRQQGKRTLFPQAFHLTGMPIKARLCSGGLDADTSACHARPAARGSCLHGGWGC